VLDSSGNPRIGYYDTTYMDLKHATWNGTKWTLTAVDSTGNIGQYASLGKDSAGRLYAGYYDATNQRLKVATWNGTSWSTQVVDGLETEKEGGP
jgi:hypothetical protein